MPGWASTVVRGRVALVLATLLAAGCSWNEVEDGPPRARPVEPRPGQVGPEPIPREEPLGRYGNPPVYNAPGGPYRTWSRERARGYRQTGKASWYGTKFHGRLTSSREVYDMYQMTAAHKHLPIPSYVRVTHRHTGRSIIVRVNDRGPFVRGRIIDLSYAAALKLGMTQEGVADVLVELIEPPAGPPLPRDMQPPAPPPPPSPSPTSSPVVIPASAPVPAPAPINIQTLPGSERIEPLEPRTPAPNAPVIVPPPAPLESPPPAPVAPRAGRMAPMQPTAPVPRTTVEELPYETAPGFYVQVAVLSTDDAAVELAERLIRQDLGSVVLMPVRVAGRSMLQVRVGPYQTAEAAEAQRQRIEQAGYRRSFVVQRHATQGPL